MIRAPSNIHEYTECYSGDEALIKDENLLRVARETGDWLPLIVDGKTPTMFTMRVIPGHLFRKIVDMEIGSAEKQSVLFRAACVGFTGLGSLKYEAVNDPDLGVIASTKLADFLDSVDTGIVNELATAAMGRVFLRPKS